MAQFIQVSLTDFEKRFGLVSKGKRVFDLIRPENEEAYYLCELTTRNSGKVVLKLLTTVRGDRVQARGCGEDAIRCFLIWKDNNGWESVISKTNRTYRSGGASSTPDDVVVRAMNKAREMAKERHPACPKCGRPMVLRNGKNGDFWGCCGFKEEQCRGYRPVQGEV